MSAILDVVRLRQRRDHGRAACDLADPAQDDLRSSVIRFYRAVNLDAAPSQPANVPNVLQITGEGHHRERTRHLVLAEVEKVNAFGANLHAHYLAGHALGFA